jgi:hypothetical protein
MSGWPRPGGWREGRIPEGRTGSTGNAAPMGCASCLRHCRRFRRGRGSARWHSAKHGQASPRRPARTVRAHHRAADLQRTGCWLARRAGPRAPMRQPGRCLECATGCETQTTRRRCLIFGFVAANHSAGEMASRVLVAVTRTTSSPPPSVIRTYRDAAVLRERRCVGWRLGRRDRSGRECRFTRRSFGDRIARSDRPQSALFGSCASHETVP